MFYDQLIKLCNANHITPTHLAKTLGFSASNVKRWKNGATVNSDIIGKIADYFEVPLGFFFDIDSDNSQMDVTEQISALKTAFNSIKTHPDFIASMMPRTTLSSHEIKQIAKYLNCAPEYLINKPLEDTDDEGNDIVPVKDFILLSIMNKLPGTKDIHYIQVRISMIIIYNLAKNNINKERLIYIGLVENKINKLYDDNIPVEKKKALNASDLEIISSKLNVSYDFMLTGKMD